MFGMTFFKYLSGGLGIGLLAAGVVILLLKIQVGNLENENEKLSNWQSGVVETVQIAAQNPEVTKDTAKDQILAMGASINALVDGIEAQNEAVDRMAQERDEALARADRERERRAAAVADARDALAALGRLENQRPPRTAEEVEQAVRDAQNLAYEAGV